ncbi:NAD(P)/FAD-dependent oxidoreductase [Convivina praedatoris]|uniref:Ferredoxin--NADP reductase n=1 Tax=Convivina praedatoris TaxID=2880963 RepID=A0ABM9D0J2_9LACO|nr:NAD(P)/FAD-dependent oxidoreductase [Convivina sp. LMG 32447]CAH1851706.1 Ferredoxin--NADP reductase 2 [Convivina sp. LMG 32447]CAH1851727.1 Ferredoxin--NADP reductase 2 [Convivina sp. LMG 32447]CAH1853122.1 Ferredoxin--NADP reductase 2 [Convivina sp. LMG 32447]
MTEVYDIVIIGGGPVGMFAAFYASLRDAKVALIEALPELGGQPLALYPDKKIYDVPGLLGVTGRDLVTNLKEQMGLFKVDILTDTTIINASRANDLFTLTTDKATILLAKTVIMATGKGSFEPRRLQIEEASKFEGVGLSYFLSQPEVLAHKIVAIVGGGDSAVELALAVEPYAKKTYLIHRRERFRALEQSVKQLENSQVEVLTPKKVTGIERRANGQLQVNLSHIKEANVTENLLADQLIVQYGFISQDQVIREWDVAPERDLYGVLVRENFVTSQPGLFAIGDVNSYPGQADLIAIGFGQAPEAVNAAIRCFDPDRGGPGHSSSLIIE